jgi:Uma2 family endonuclease
MNRLQVELHEMIDSPGMAEGYLRRQLAEWLLTSAQPRQMTYEEFLAWADEDTLAEWVDGKVIMASPSSRDHQEIAGFLLEIMHAYCQARGLGEVVPPPFQMKLAKSGREPDLIFIAQDHLDRMRKTYLDGPADLVVEITSPESVRRDRGEKFAEYEEAGIPEYWLIDPQARRAEFYVLDAEGRYDRVLRGGSGMFHSTVVSGFWLMAEWLWDDPSPSALRTLATIAGVEPAIVEAFERALSSGL